jgi:Xaa-Pro aminopeptidase
MKINRREFTTMAGLYAAGLLLPWTALADAKTNVKTSFMGSPVAAPDPGKNWHPLAAKRPHKDIMGRIQGIMKREGYGAFILMLGENVCYATGYFSKFAYTPSLPIGAQTIAVIPADGNAHICVSSYEADDARRQVVDDVKVEAMPGFVFIDDGTPESRAEKDPRLDPLVTVKSAVKIAKDVAGNGKIGTEIGMLSWAFKDVMEKALGADRLSDCSDLMYESRLIKFPWEIDMLRLSAQHAERWMTRVAQELKPGMNAAVFDKICQMAAWEEDTENSMSLLGYQTAIGPYWGIGLAPRNYVIQEGDVCRIDGGSTHLGYISDIARTWVVGGSEGKPDQKHVETYDALYSGMKKGLDMLGPGVVMGDFYEAVRAEVEKSPIFPNYARGHVGHSISVKPQAEDSLTISRGQKAKFEPGMVVCVEFSYMAAQGAYAPGGYNIEDTFAITEDGYDRFTMANDHLIWNV